MHPSSFDIAPGFQLLSSATQHCYLLPFLAFCSELLHFTAFQWPLLCVCCMLCQLVDCCARGGYCRFLGLLWTAIWVGWEPVQSLGDLMSWPIVGEVILTPLPAVRKNNKGSPGMWSWADSINLLFSTPWYLDQGQHFAKTSFKFSGVEHLHWASLRDKLRLHIYSLPLKDSLMSLMKLSSYIPSLCNPLVWNGSGNI